MEFSDIRSDVLRRAVMLAYNRVQLELASGFERGRNLEMRLQNMLQVFADGLQSTSVDTSTSLPYIRWMADKVRQAPLAYKDGVQTD